MAFGRWPGHYYDLRPPHHAYARPPDPFYTRPYGFEGIPMDKNEANEEIKRLEGMAELSTQPLEVCNLYEQALAICRHHGFVNTASKILCKRASYAMKHDMLDDAINDADNCITADPDYLEGYHLCAATRHCYWKQNRSAKSSVVRAIQNYIEYYRRSPQKNVKAVEDLCTAIILAVDSNNTAALKFHTDFLKRDQCTRMISVLVDMKYCCCKHIQFVVTKTDATGSGIALRLNCDLSELKASKIFKKSDVGKATLEALVKLGTKIKPACLEKAVKYISDDKLPVLEYAVATCDPKLDDESLTSLCEQSLSLRKAELSVYLIEQGAHPDNESMIKAVNTKSPNEKLVASLTSTPDGCVCLLMHALNESALALAERCLEGNTLIFSQVLNLSDFITSSKDLLCQHPTFLEELLKVGVEADGLHENNSGPRPIDMALALPKDFQNRVKLISILIDHGADLTKASFPRSKGTTIFHIATEIAIDQNDTQIMEKVCTHYQFSEDFDGNLQATNKEGQTPYHLIMQRKQSDTTVKLCEILSNCPINPSLTDNRGHRPADFKNPKYKGDRRVPILKETANKFQTQQSRRKAKSSASKSSGKKGSSNSNKKKGKGDIEHPNLEPSPTSDDVPTSDLSTPGSVVPKGSPTSENPDIQTLRKFMDCISTKPPTYFETPLSYKRQSSSSQKSRKKDLSTTSEQDNKQQKAAERNEGVVQKVEIDTEDRAIDTKERAINKDDILANFDDSLKWEVEFPEKVVKSFKRMTNTKILCSAIEKIKRLANGIPTNNRKLCKLVRGDESERIYETRVTKAVRILWEVAYQFSPKLTSKLRDSSKSEEETGNNIYLYSEVIRIWDIVEDHDNLNRSIDLAVKRIQRCRKRGEQATERIPLLSNDEEHSSSRPGHSDEMRYPRVFTNTQLDKETNEKLAKQVYCYPAGNTKDDEYNVLTFYSFNSSFVRSILEGEDARRDFPYKEWPKEHDIINMSGRSILLLGRSGTGKTTCCLYRLWNSFQNYWSRADSAGPLMDARPLTFHDEVIDTDKSDSDDIKESVSDSEVDTQNVKESSSETAPMRCTSTSEQETVSEELESSNEEQVKAKPDLEHLHQVFITKNYVLCAQMKKRFYDLAADVAKQHMPFEDAERPTSLAEFDDYSYPLFLTAREFFILLDNSLNDNCQFFKREENGKLSEKIRSSDYDHEDQDTLLDLDWDSDQDNNSGSESSDDEDAKPQADTKVKQSQRSEVTASYFVEKIWPNIHHICEDKKTDPLLIWMEIKSFIKGSMKAVENEDGYLTEGEYEDLGKKMAANFAGNRQEVYKVFKKYQEFITLRAEENVFDECEFVHNLLKRLRKLKDLPFSIHSFYVDEVQDFTQAELSILLRCCKDPNNLFLTGDTAQSIMRGVSFRFSDLRSLFHKANEQVAGRGKKDAVTVPKVDELTINFRSHSGVLELAASVIDILQKYFPSSFDRLPGDKGMFPGPTPTLLDSCNFSDLALVLRGNKRESSAIEFGAHQVIIVQTEDAKRNLPNELKAGIALTVFEAKGLEFDDVLLYDFFKDSKVLKEWRIVTDYIESSPQLLSTPDTKGFYDKPRALTFDEQHHKSLCAELKYLYTAITRAKCNLWIYDSDEKKRLPMFDYWNRRNLVKIICLDEISEKDESVLFAATSSKEEWKKQGDYFKKKKLWEPAMKCYEKAEDVYLEKEAKAYCLVQKARTSNLRPREMEEMYLQAAIAFLECDKSQHDVKFLRYAASFLKKAKRSNEAGLLYAKLSRHKDAVKEFKKTRNFMGLVQLKEQEGNYDEAVRILVKNNRRDDALKCSQRYESQGHTIESELQTSALALMYAKNCEQAPSTKNRNQLLSKLVGYMKDPMDRVYFLKVAKKYRDALEILDAEGRSGEACRLCAAQVWADDGLKIAEREKDQKWTFHFVFQKAVASLCRDAKLSSDIMARLHSLKSTNSHAHESDKAKAYLFLGKANHDFFLCRTAFKMYLSIHDVAGSTEAFNLMIQFRSAGNQSTKISIKETIDACNGANDAVKLLNCVVKDTAALSATQAYKLGLLEDFYGLQKPLQYNSQNTYCLTSGQHLWVKFYSEADSLDQDSDGMLTIDLIRAMKVVRGHIQEFLQRWRDKDELQIRQSLQSCLTSFRFHKQLEDGGCVCKSFKLQYEGRKLYEYIRLCFSGHDIADFGDREIRCSNVTQLLINLLKPAAALYLGVTRGQMEWIASSSCAYVLQEHAVRIIRKSDRNFSVDDWLEAWSVLSVLGKDHLLRHLDVCRENANRLSDPAVYKYSKEYDCRVHVFSLWIRSCFLLQRDKKVITSSKVVLHHFLKSVITSRIIRQTVSVTSLVNILAIHTTALLSLTSLCNYLQEKRSSVLIPHSYERLLNVFDNIGLLADKSCVKVLEACINEERIVKAYKDKMKENPYAIQNIQKDITGLLWQILDMLLGRQWKYYNPLMDAMMSKECINRGETRHCLLLTLVLLGNLTEIDNQCDPRRIQSYHQNISDTFKHTHEYKDEECLTLRKAFNIFSASNNSTGFFLAINQLITTPDPHDHIIRVNARRLPWKYDLERAHLQQYPARPLFPVVVRHQDQGYQRTLSTSGNVQSTGPGHQTFSRQLSNPSKSSAPLLEQAVNASVTQQAPMVSTRTQVSSPHDQLRTAVPDAQITTSTERRNTTEGASISPETSAGPTVDTLSVDVPTGATNSLARQTSEREEIDMNLDELDDEDLSLAAPLVHDRQTNVVSPETSTVSSNVAENTSMLDKEFCRYCGIPLKLEQTDQQIVEHEEGTPDESVDTDSDQIVAESYDTHCKSESHNNKVKAYEKFSSLKRDFYEPLKDKLVEVLRDMKQLETEYSVSTLHVSIKELENELQTNERSLTHVADWKMAASQIEHEMLGRMDLLISTAERLLSAEKNRCERVAREQETTIEEPAAIDDDYGDDDGSQSEEEINRNITAKDKERRHKKQRKEARKRRK